MVRVSFFVAKTHNYHVRYLKEPWFGIYPQKENEKTDEHGNISQGQHTEIETFDLMGLGKKFRKVT